MNCTSCTGIHVTEFRNVDSGTTLRALELALTALDEASPPDPVRLATACGGDPDGLALRLAESAGVTARSRNVTADAIRRNVAAGASVVAQVGDGWLVATRHGSRLVTAAGERRAGVTRRTLRKASGQETAEAIILEPSQGLERVSERGTRSKSPWSRLRALVALERREVIALVVYAVALGGLSLAVPVAVQVLVNTIAFGSLLQPLIALAGLLLGVLVLSGAIQVVQWYAVEILHRRIFVRVAEDFSRRLAATRYSVHDETNVRELSNRFFEVVSLQKSSSRLLLDGLGLALQTVVGLLLLAFYHPVLLAFDVALIVALLMVVALGHGAVPTAVAESAAKYRVAAWLQTVAGAPGVFKRGEAGVFAAQRADALTRGYLIARRRHYRRVLLQLVGGVGIQVVAMVSLLGLGGWLVMQGELTLGQLVAAELVVGIIGSGFSKIGKHLETAYDLLASVDKLGKVVDLPTEPVSPRARATVRPLGLELHGLAARPGGPLTSATILPRARVLVRGAGGAGKSRLLEILAGLREPSRGDVRAEGGEMCDGVHRRRHALLVASDSLLVGGSVIDNLRVADPGLDEARAWDALQQVGIAGLVTDLEAGLETPVHRATFGSSAGTLLCLARAFVARPDLLLLDGTLDAVEDEELLDALLGLRAPWTAIVVGDGPQLRVRCSQTITLEGGHP